MRRAGRSKNSFPNQYRVAKLERHDYEPEAHPHEYAARLREIPPDDRTPAQRLMGEPIPSQSALGRRQSP